VVQLWNSTGAPELQTGPLLELPELELPPELDPVALDPLVPLDPAIELPVEPELPPDVDPPLDVDPPPELPPLLLPEPGTQMPRSASFGWGCVQTCWKPQLFGPNGKQSVWQVFSRQAIPAAQSCVGAARKPGCTQTPNVSPPWKQRDTGRPCGDRTGTHEPGGPPPATRHSASRPPPLAPPLWPQGFGWQKPFAPQVVSMKGQSAKVWQGYSQSCCW
jgi:hypothetical protein